MSKVIEKRLKKILTIIESKIKVHLEVCDKPAEKVFLLAYIEQVLDSVTASWFDLATEEIASPYFEYPEQSWIGKFIPSAITWYEPNLLRTHRAIHPHLFELHPKYQIQNSEIKFVVDFALFYPRTDLIPEKIKVAIYCDSLPSSSESNELTQKTQEEAVLKSLGWVIARFDGTKILKTDVFDLITYVESIASNRDEALFYKTEMSRKNWQLN